MNKKFECPRINLQPGGLELSRPSPSSSPTPCPSLWCTSKANAKQEAQTDLITTKLSYASPRNSVFPLLEESPTDIGSRQDPMLQGNTSGKKKPGSQVRSSNSARRPSVATPKPTGMPYWSVQKEQVLMKYRRMFTFVITLQSAESLKSLLRRVLLKETAMFTGESLEVAKVIELGTRRELELTVKTPLLSGGMDIEVKNTLLLMNFVVVYQSATCCDGLTSILSWWKEKEVQYPLKRKRSG